MGSFFYNNCRNSDILYWSRAFELILYLAGLTSWCLRIKFPPSLFMNTMNLVYYLNLSLSLHNTHNHCHPFIKKGKKTAFLPFKVCDIVIVIHTTNLYNLGKELITVCWNKQQHIGKLIIRKINLIQSFFYSNDNDNNNKKQHFNCSVKKKQEVNIMLIWGFIIILIILTLTVGLVNLHHQLLDNVHYILLRNLQEERLFRTVPILYISRLAKYHDSVASLTILRPISRSHKFTTYFLHCLQKTHWRISKAHFQIRGQTQSTENT